MHEGIFYVNCFIKMQFLHNIYFLKNATRVYHSPRERKRGDLNIIKKGFFKALFFNMKEKFI